jgi:hypothetical protein
MRDPSDYDMASVGFKSSEELYLWQQQQARAEENLLTDDEIKALLPDAVRLPPGWREFARKVEAAVLRRNNVH